MTSLAKIRTTALGLAALFALGCASGEGLEASSLTNLSAQDRAKLATWDQARVASIAETLAPAINEVYVSLNTLKTGAQVGSGQANAFARLKDRLRVARIDAQHLATQLKDGQGREETVLTYARLMMVIRDARVDGQKMFIAAPTLDKIAVAGDLLRQMAPYYDPEANARSGE